MAEYIEREAIRDALYDADAITMNGVKILNQFPSSDVEPVQQWIPVYDELPEVGGYVVCIAKRNPFSRFMPMVARIEKNGWVNPITEQYISEIRHWMPLPEPPMSAIMDGDAERRNT